MKIGVFDSGVGGLSVARAIQQALPDAEVIVREDRIHVPYGTRPPGEILSFLIPILQKMIDDGCQVIVIACNTVTTTLIRDLRERFGVPLVAVEPMIKPASLLTKTKVIVVCATPTTLASSRYKELKEEFAKGIKVIEPDCSDWSAMIEANRIDRAKIEARIMAALEEGADVVVLACTHYHWIEKEIGDLAQGHAHVLQPEQAVIVQLKRVISDLELKILKA